MIMKKFIYTSIIVILLTSLLTNTVFAHPSLLYVEYDECSKEENMSGEDELWYRLDNLDGQEMKMVIHLSHEITTIYYYFLSYTEDGQSMAWTNCVKTVWQDRGVNITDIEAMFIVQQIQSIISISMKMWNNIYYYSYENNERIKSNKVINVVHGNANNCNIIITPSSSDTVAAIRPGDPSTLQSATGYKHYHQPDFEMQIGIGAFFDILENPNTKNTAKSAAYKSNAGAHEIGHVLGLADLDEWDCRCTCEANTDDDKDTKCTHLGHHEEALMGYGEYANRVTHITYRDIAGASITRGFHNDGDHLWMLRTNEDGTNDVICALCNGVRYNINLNDAEYIVANVNEYGYQSCVHHGGTNEEMILVATDLTRNFYTCRYCRHIEETEHTHIIEYEEKDDFTHIGSCVCGYVSGEFEHEYDTFSQNNSITHIATCNCGKEIEQGHVYTHCKPTANNHTLLCECGHSEIENHNYSEWAKYNASFHIEKCLCGATGTIKNPHAVRLSDPIINGCRPCMTCGYLVPSDNGPTQIIHTITKYSVNGSYILPSGVIVLVDEDVEAYFNGTLVFYEKDKLPVTQ